MEFKLTTDEVEKYKIWKKEQMIKNDSYHSVNGGRFSFIFTKTSVCDLVEVLDNETNDKIMLTEIDF